MWLSVPAGKSNTHPYAAGSTGECLGQKFIARLSLSKLLMRLSFSAMVL